MHHMKTTRVNALADARRALRGMELAIRKARFHRAGVPQVIDSLPAKARRLPAIGRARDVRQSG
jgi:hypothetical protein